MPTSIEPAVMTIQDFSRWASIGRTRIYVEINSGALRIFKLGRRTYIRTVDAQAWLNGCAQASGSRAQDSGNLAG